MGRLSGIVGLLWQDVGDVSPDLLGRMTAAVSERGPIGPRTALSGRAGVGQVLLPTTPEDRHEKLPRTAGPLTAVMDGRIDNRGELITRLKARGNPITDSELLLAAYREWGVDCPKHIVGAFAFAIYDGDADRLICARDHMGIRPLVYHRTDEFLGVASEAKALFELDGVEPTPDELRVGEYLAGLRDDPDRSFFDSVAHLPAGNVLVADDDGVRTRRYWTLDPGARVELPGDRAYARQFRALFEQAVDCRLRSTDPVMATLSGGLDSSSVCCVARDRLADSDRTPLRTLSVEFPDVPESDEHEYIDTVLDTGGFDPTRIRGDQAGPLAGLSSRLASREEPFNPEVFAFNYEFFRAAARTEGTVLLEGMGGDQTVSYGWGLLRELARQGRWLRLYREAGNFADVWDTSRRAILYDDVLKPLLPGPLRRLYLRLRPPSLEKLNPSIDPEFGRRIGLAEQIRRLRGKTRPRTHAGLHRKTLSNPRLTASLEATNKVAVRHGFQPRYPFYDRRLVEFSVALPAEQAVREGRHRHVLREAMHGILPERVRTRVSKAEFTSAFVYGLSEFDRPRLEAVLEDGESVVGRYLDVDLLQEAYERFAEEPTTEDARQLSKAAVLYDWLQVCENEFT